MLISVIFSFRNEAQNLPELVQRVRSTLGAIPNLKSELIFVNDDSSDQSLEILLKMREQGCSEIRVINMSRRFGVSECVMAGLRVCRGDAAIYMDADLQDPPEVMTEMINLWKAGGIDLVYTSRLSRAGEGRIKLFLTRIGYAILGAVSEVDIPNNSGDFKLLSRRVIDQVCQLSEKKPFIRGLTHWVGFKQAQIFYHREARHSGSSKFPVLGKKVMLNFLDSALISFSDAPLKFGLALGFSFVLIAGFMLIYILAEKLLGIAIPGWSAIMVTVVAMSGVQILMIGLMGLYINAIFLEVKNRPLYIVKDIVGFDEDIRASRQDRHETNSPS